MVCITVIVRRPWTEDEKLAYSIIQLPARMTSEGFFTNRLMWIAFGLVATFDIVNGLHHVFPAIPSVYEKAYRFRFTEKPFSAIGLAEIRDLPFCFRHWISDSVGSVVFELVFLLGVEGGNRSSEALWAWEGTGYPYVNYQGFGAYMGIFLIAVWRSRKHLQNIIGGRKYVPHPRGMNRCRPRILCYRIDFWRRVSDLFLFESGYVPLGDSCLLWTLFCFFNGGFTDAS